MSGRRRRPETSWDRKEDDEISGGRIPWQGKESQSNFRGDGSPKRSNSEANDAFMPRDFSREPMRGNENMPVDPAFDEWENQYSSRPSDHGYDLPYRGGDRVVGGTGNMSKDRNRSRSRSWSPHRSGSGRGWDRDRGYARDRERSRSRSRGRDPGRGRGRSRSPFDDERRDLYESADVRNDSRVSSRPSRGGNRSDNDLTEKWSRSEYSGGSRFHDDRNSTDRPRTKGSDGYRKDTTRNRNAYDDQDHRRQWNQSTKPLPCRYFLVGNCNRNNCKFSHDAPKPGSNDRPWNEQQPQDHTSALDFQKSNSNFDDNSKPWNGPTWDDVESGGFDQVSREHILDARSQKVIPEVSGSQFTNVTATTMPQGDSNVNMVIGNSDAYNLVSVDTNQQFRSYNNMTSQFPSTLNGTEKSSEMFPNAPKLQLNGSAQGMFSHIDLQKPVEVQKQDGREPLETSKSDTPASLPHISQNQILANALELLYSLPNAASSGAPVDSTVVSDSMKTIVPMVPMSNALEPENQASVELIGVPKTKHEHIGGVSVNENAEAKNPKGQQENPNPGKTETKSKVEEDGNDEKAMRQFKVALVEFVKDILKPTWKEGKMSREVYKTIVKKVVDKVTSTIQGTQIPRTQEKIDQYLAFSKSKITKLVEAYVGRFLKA